MFGLEKETILKRNIIEILDQESDFLTTTELKNRLGSGSTNKVLQSCREIKNIFNFLYPNEDVKIRLIINQHNGIRLERNTNDFHIFYIYLFKNDVSYQTITKLIINNVVSVDDLQEQLAISLSGLQRKVRSINESIAIFNLRITGSKKLTIQGDEKSIRIFFFIFLWGIHRQISYIDWIDNPDDYKKIATNISNYLNHPQKWAKNEQLAIWVYIFDLRTSLNTSISFTSLENKVINLHEIKSKPEFLSQWTSNDWKFLLMVLWHSGIFSFPINIDVQKAESYDQLAFIQNWIYLFESEYLPLSKKQVHYVQRKLFQQYVVSLFCNLNISDDSQQDLLYYFDGYLDDSMAPHKAEFEVFWQKFTHRSRQKFLPAKGLNFLLFQSLIPLNYFSPIIKIYLLTDLNEILENHIKQQLRYVFNDQFKIHFVDEAAKADIILSTVPSFSSPLLIEQKIIFIRSRLFSNDLKNIEQAIKEIKK